MKLLSIDGAAHLYCAVRANPQQITLSARHTPSQCRVRALGIAVVDEVIEVRPLHAEVLGGRLGNFLP
jgi:hypothetical protein